jgi:hypothetical protein
LKSRRRKSRQRKSRKWSRGKGSRGEGSQWSLATQQIRLFLILVLTGSSFCCWWQCIIGA